MRAVAPRANGLAKPEWPAGANSELERPTLGRGNIETSRPLRFAVSVLGITLIQTGYVAGFNGSMADALCFALLALMVPGTLRIPVGPAVFFLAVCAITLLTAAFVTPHIFDVEPGLPGMLRGLVKYLITFAFFVLGYNLARRNGLLRLFRCYSWSVLIVGAIGIVLTVTGSGALREALFLDAGDRYRGLVSDPNHWATLVVTGLPYFMRPGAFGTPTRVGVATVALASVLVTGSKTGTLALLAFLAYLAIRWAITSTRSQQNLLLVLISMVALLLLMPLLPSMEATSQFVTRYVPVAERISTLFLDTQAALNEGGSGREDVLSGAIAVISVSPLLGVGVDQYLSVVTSLTRNYALAHNTYLQMAADWGIPLTVVFLGAVMVLMVKGPALSSESRLVRMQREALAVLLIGSLSVSFNNVRLFWLLLGSLSYFVLGSRGDPIKVVASASEGGADHRRSVHVPDQSGGQRSGPA